MNKAQKLILLFSFTLLGVVLLHPPCLQDETSIITIGGPCSCMCFQTPDPTSKLFTNKFHYEWIYNLEETKKIWSLVYFPRFFFELFLLIFATSFFLYAFKKSQKNIPFSLKGVFRFSLKELLLIVALTSIIYYYLAYIRGFFIKHHLMWSPVY